MADRIYNIAVCDDEIKDINYIKEAIEKYYPEKSFLFEAFTKTEDIIEQMKKKEYDLLLLDLFQLDCGNEIIGALLLEYGIISRNNNIEFDWKGSIRDELAFNEIDIADSFGNLLKMPLKSA